jgi:hypothetical protein
MGYTPNVHMGAQGYIFVSNLAADMHKISMGGPWFWGNATLTLFMCHAGFNPIQERIHTSGLGKNVVLATRILGNPPSSSS